MHVCFVVVLRASSPRPCWRCKGVAKPHRQEAKPWPHATVFPSPSACQVLKPNSCGPRRCESPHQSPASHGPAPTDFTSAFRASWIRSSVSAAHIRCAVQAACQCLLAASNFENLIILVAALQSCNSLPSGVVGREGQGPIPRTDLHRRKQPPQYALHVDHCSHHKQAELNLPKKLLWWRANTASGACFSNENLPVPISRCACSRFSRASLTF